MKIPAIRGKIGLWTYYSGLMTFEQIANNVIPCLIHNVNVLVLITKDLIKQHKFVGEITANAFILQIQ